VATDAKGNVYVGDRSNSRIEVFDNDLTFKTTSTMWGSVGGVYYAGAAPVFVQLEFVSGSNNYDLAASSGEIYKMELDGTVLGKFGAPGKQLGGFATVHEIDCRNPNELLISEITAWRVQKISAASRSTI